VVARAELALLGAFLVRVAAVAVWQDDRHDDEEDDDQPRDLLDLHHLRHVRAQRNVQVLDEVEALDVLQPVLPLEVELEHAVLAALQPDAQLAQRRDPPAEEGARTHEARGREHVRELERLLDQARDAAVRGEARQVARHFRRVQLLELRQHLRDEACGQHSAMAQLSLCCQPLRGRPRRERRAPPRC